ncbi:OLC1v1029616C1 [Oldenlandia corymbosa var. corymbosa]|uniref:OLC1v1029616C1 n=1 Tax=Oldenlandia corymbosa var. corymbosa TaxID=529605 RepID=A0AAV1CH80_OLDCO|nr:OLC1v1029616C1 [Oldenlandia corymbosa var. corymbosa]
MEGISGNQYLRHLMATVMRRAAVEEPLVSDEANWSDLPRDLLLNIFSKLNELDRIVNIAAVCKSWREAVSDPLFSSTFDMVKCREQTFNRFYELHYPCRRSLLEAVFRCGINLGLANLTTLVFDPLFHVSDSHLLYAAPKCPNLRELVLPDLSDTTDEGLTDAFKHWTQLRSLFVAYDFGSPTVDIFSIAGESCPNLNVLKISTTVLHMGVASEIVTYMPELKLLSMFCTSFVMPDSFKLLLSGLTNLEEVYLAMDKINFTKCPEGCPCVPTILKDGTIMEKTLRLRNCHVCCIQKYDRCVATTMVGAAPLSNIPPS